MIAGFFMELTVVFAVERMVARMAGCDSDL
jgi:hypothetical protein